ncbi:hypothetical protein ACF0H5_002153 [Mactra antiquata]
MTYFIIFTLAFLLLSTDVNFGQKTVPEDGDGRYDVIEKIIKKICKKKIKVGTLKQKLEEQIPTARTIGFTAEASAMNLHYLDENQTIKFDRVVSNIGNAYHPHTGIFGVPNSGVFVFSVTATSSLNKEVTLQLMVDGRPIFNINLDSRDKRWNNSATKTYVLQLSAGSDVWVAMSDWHGNDDIHGNMLTSFTGFLLQST